jgi:hypothetical protein
MMPPENGDSPGPQFALLRFEGPDGGHAVPIPVPPEEATLLDLLPAAQEISGKTT